MPSSKRSAASSTPDRRRKRKVFFVDRSVGRHMVVDALRSAGYEVVAHDEQFAQDTLDEDWLTSVGAKGWIVITRDKRIRHRVNELQALRAGRVVAFVVSAGSATGDEVAALLVKHADRMIDMALGVRPPAVFSLSKSEPPKRLTLPRWRG